MSLPVDPKPGVRPEPQAAHDHLNHAQQTTTTGSQAADSFASSTKGKAGFTRIIKATGYSTDGFIAAYKTEAAFRQVLWLNLALFIAIIFVPFVLPIKMMLLIGSFLSLIVELFNTGIEASVDHASTEQHPLAKIAKDVGSAAQFLALLLLFLLWSLAIWGM